MKNYLTKLAATFFGIGFIPVAPGTFGSLAGGVIYYLLHTRKTVFYAVLFLLAIVGFYVCGKAEILFNKKDPKCVVIDEVVGVMIAFVFVPFTWFNIAMVFLLFRFMDIVKPYPIKKLESLPGSAGIMFDDILAGVYANLAFQLGLIVASYKFV